MKTRGWLSYLNVVLFFPKEEIGGLHGVWDDDWRVAVCSNLMDGVLVQSCYRVQVAWTQSKHRLYHTGVHFSCM